MIFLINLMFPHLIPDTTTNILLLQYSQPAHFNSYRLSVDRSMVSLILQVEVAVKTRMHQCLLCYINFFRHLTFLLLRYFSHVHDIYYLDLSIVIFILKNDSLAVLRNANISLIKFHIQNDEYFYILK